MSLPPNLDAHACDLIRQGRWSCVKTETGWEVFTEPYSRCCNPQGQTKYVFDSSGAIVAQEIIPTGDRHD